MDNLTQDTDMTRMPQHVAIIMDGNGRWAKKRGMMRIFGHQNAIEAVRQTVTAAAELGIKYLSLYAFSTENWNRSEAEVSGLMKLLSDTIEKEIKTLLDNGVRLITTGDTDRLPKDNRSGLANAIEKTKNGSRMTLNLCLSYSGRWDITQAVKRMTEDVENGLLDTSKINEDTISSYLSMAGIPDPDLLIRTSGELRISNFFLWQAAYTEFYFTDKLWPDFRKEDFIQAISEYQKRDRRFGTTK